MAAVRQVTGCRAGSRAVTVLYGKSHYRFTVGHLSWNDNVSFSLGVLKV